MKKTRSINLFDGELDHENSTVTVDGHAFACTIPQELAGVSEALVTIKPQDVSLVRPDENVLTGFVRSSMFLGTHYEVHVECEENDWIAFSDDFMEDGEEIGVQVSPEGIELSEH